MFARYFTTTIFNIFLGNIQLVWYFWYYWYKDQSDRIWTSVIAKLEQHATKASYTQRDYDETRASHLLVYDFFFAFSIFALIVTVNFVEVNKRATRDVQKLLVTMYLDTRYCILHNSSYSSLHSQQRVICRPSEDINCSGGARPWLQPDGYRQDRCDGNHGVTM